MNEIKLCDCGKIIYKNNTTGKCNSCRVTRKTVNNQCQYIIKPRFKNSVYSYNIERRCSHKTRKGEKYCNIHLKYSIK